MMPPRYKVGLSAKYHRLTKNPGDDGFVDSQFIRPSPKVPYHAIAMATVLFVLGSALIILGAFLLAGFLDVKYSDRTWPILIIGSLMFVPGAYHVRIAYYAWKGYNGYSYSDIPEVD